MPFTGESHALAAPRRRRLRGAAAGLRAAGAGGLRARAAGLRAVGRARAGSGAGGKSNRANVFDNTHPSYRRKRSRDRPGSRRGGRKADDAGRRSSFRPISVTPLTKNRRNELPAGSPCILLAEFCITVSRTAWPGGRSGRACGCRPFAGVYFAPFLSRSCQRSGEMNSGWQYRQTSGMERRSACGAQGGWAGDRQRTARRS